MASEHLDQLKEREYFRLLTGCDNVRRREMTPEQRKRADQAARVDLLPGRETPWEAWPEGVPREIEAAAAKCADAAKAGDIFSMPKPACQRAADELVRMGYVVNGCWEYDDVYGKRVCRVDVVTKGGVQVELRAECWDKLLDAAAAMKAGTTTCATAWARGMAEVEHVSPKPGDLVLLRMPKIAGRPEFQGWIRKAADGLAETIRAKVAPGVIVLVCPHNWDVEVGAAFKVGEAPGAPDPAHVPAGTYEVECLETCPDCHKLYLEFLQKWNANTATQATHKELRDAYAACRRCHGRGSVAVIRKLAVTASACTVTGTGGDLSEVSQARPDEFLRSDGQWVDGHWRPLMQRLFDLKKAADEQGQPLLPGASRDDLVTEIEQAERQAPLPHPVLCPKCDALVARTDGKELRPVGLPDNGRSPDGSAQIDCWCGHRWVWKPTG